MVNNNLENLEKDNFVIVGTSYQKAEQLVGRSSSNFVQILKRFFKNFWGVFFLSIFLTIILMAIFIPVFSNFAPNTMISTLPFAKNLPPRILGDEVTTKVMMSKFDFDYFFPEGDIRNKVVVSFSYISEGVNGDSIVNAVIKPYLFPELKDYNCILGTDASAADMWTNLWVSIGNSLLLAFGTAIIAIIFGAIYGSISGSFVGRNTDVVMMRIVEIISGVPQIIWIIIMSFFFNSLFGFTTSLSKDVSNVSLMCALVFILWPSAALTTRTYVLRCKDAEYVQATKTLGGSQVRIIFKHMLSTILGRIIVILVNMIPTVIFYESALVFLGLKPTTGLGMGTLLENARNSIYDLNIVVPPILVFSLFTISAQILANALNDAIDPRIMKGK